MKHKKKNLARLGLGVIGATIFAELIKTCSEKYITETSHFILPDILYEPSLLNIALADIG
jgi:hypothetical protein